MSLGDFPVDGMAVAISRLNIDEFSGNTGYKIQWALYLRAQIVLQNRKPEDPFGYHGLAGIHGLPVKTWPQGIFVPGKGYYCAHSRPAFLTWHRAYLLLFEKRVIEEAVKLAGLAPANLRADYEAEAYKIRLPYWDWGHTSPLPKSLRSTEVEIIIPEIDPNLPTKIRNPLYSYVNTVVPHLETIRQDTVEMDRLMKQEKLGGQIYHDLTHEQGYGPFSNTGYGARADSVEQPHNFVHNTVGGPLGEMANDAVAAYDPVFWLHHASVDRYYALWQVLHPKKLYEENKPTHDTVDNILSPFYRSNPHGWWTSRMVQRTAGKKPPNTYDYGVQYPETLQSYSEAARLQAVKEAVDRLYKPRAELDTGVIPTDLIRGVSGFPTFLPDDTSIRREWRVAISVRKDLMDGNFGIFFFFDAAGDDTKKWGTRAIDAGSFMTFKGPIESCPNCEESKDQWIYGSIYLTDHIYELLQGLKSHSPTAIPYVDEILAEAGRTDKRVLERWLKEHLDWRIRKRDGTEYVLQQEDLGKFRVEVESFLEAYNPLPPAGMEVDVDKQFGVTFDHAMHFDITKGKADRGGASGVLEVRE